MSRFRWLEAEWPLQIATLVARLNARKFSASTPSGFIVDRVRDEFVEARYVERYEYSETTTDPFGLETSIDRVEYRQCAFRMDMAWPGLEIMDGPRSAQGLISQLVEICDFSLSICPLSIDLFEWTGAFVKAFTGEVCIESIQIGALEVNEQVFAKMILKGEGDLRKSFHELTLGRRHIVEKLQLRVGREGLRALIVISNNATLKIEGADFGGGVLKSLRESMPKG